MPTMILKANQIHSVLETFTQRLVQSLKKGEKEAASRPRGEAEGVRRLIMERVADSILADLQRMGAPSRRGSEKRGDPGPSPASFSEGKRPGGFRYHRVDGNGVKTHRHRSARLDTDARPEEDDGIPPFPPSLASPN
jgi:hypothetical protein